MSIQPQSTFSLAKAIHYTYFAKQYLEDVIVSEGLTGGAKHFVNGLINRQERVLSEIYTRIPDSRTLLKHEIEGRDIAAIDSILNMVILLGESDRLELEDYIQNTFLNKNN